MSGSLLLAAIAVWFVAGAVLSYFARAAGAGGGMSGFFLANRGIGGVVSAMTWPFSATIPLPSNTRSVDDSPSPAAAYT